MNGVKTLEEIKMILEKAEEKLKKDYGVKKIGIFGSFVRGEFTEDSDIDILVEFFPDAEMDLIKFVELEEYLTELIGIKVDLVMKSGLKSNIGKRIMEEVIFV